jgi:hypothetical protein
VILKTPSRLAGPHSGSVFTQAAGVRFASPMMSLNAAGKTRESVVKLPD